MPQIVHLTPEMAAFLEQDPDFDLNHAQLREMQEAQSSQPRWRIGTTLKTLKRKAREIGEIPEEVRRGSEDSTASSFVEPPATRLKTNLPPDDHDGRQQSTIYTLRPGFLTLPNPRHVTGPLREPILTPELDFGAQSPKGPIDLLETPESRLGDDEMTNGRRGSVQSLTSHVDDAEDYFFHPTLIRPIERADQVTRKSSGMSVDTNDTMRPAIEQLQHELRRVRFGVKVDDEQEVEAEISDKADSRRDSVISVVM